MTDKIEITPEIQKLIDATGLELYDSRFDDGLETAVLTHESIDEFIAGVNTWNERSSVVRGKIAGFDTAYWGMVQRLRGDSREELAIIDMEDFRLVFFGIALLHYIDKE